MAPLKITPLHPSLGAEIAGVDLSQPVDAPTRQALAHALADRGPARFVHVACDPAALARDVSAFADRGYRLAALRAFDAFLMTHHVECVALLTRQPPGVSALSDT